MKGKYAREARGAYLYFLPSSFLCASWHKFCCKPSLCKDKFLKRIRTFSSNFACHQASNVLTREEMALPSAHSILPQHGCAVRWHRSRPAVAQRNGFRPSPFPPSSLPLFVPLSLPLFDSLSFSLFLPSSCLYNVFTLFLQLVRMRNRILTESVADTHSFVSGCHLRKCYVLP